ncbi:uncharacterized protein LOC18430704 isoform X1 [Amborella trichopoda]|uniref:uncharacterized protein LOC18430704 isoform X1 n=1 Tax=Amborella trichopoda TaxID=13333 RepID=UPI0009C080E1|nr:uncharacterized protein LOC18430704 isoform X1 [Amborella trichopoda]|eukprot:XP_020520781.1 uncharacterized protein LOC18430704 isoform X1 [Amborella trichopoda]
MEANKHKTSYHHPPARLDYFVDAGQDKNDIWVCHKCGWTYPNPHPSAKHRRNHKKHCGKIEGFKLIDSDDKSHTNLSDKEASDEDHEPQEAPKPAAAASLSDDLKDLKDAGSEGLSNEKDVNSEVKREGINKTEEEESTDAVAEFTRTVTSLVPATSSAVGSEHGSVMESLGHDSGVVSESSPLITDKMVNSGGLFPPDETMQHCEESTSKTNGTEIKNETVASDKGEIRELLLSSEDDPKDPLDSIGASEQVEMDHNASGIGAIPSMSGLACILESDHRQVKVLGDSEPRTLHFEESHVVEAHSIHVPLGQNESIHNNLSQKPDASESKTEQLDSFEDSFPEQRDESPVAEAAENSRISPNCPSKILDVGSAPLTESTDMDGNVMESIGVAATIDSYVESDSVRNLSAMEILAEKHAYEINSNSCEVYGSSEVTDSKDSISSSPEEKNSDALDKPSLDSDSGSVVAQVDEKKSEELEGLLVSGAETITKTGDHLRGSPDAEMAEVISSTHEKGSHQSLSQGNKFMESLDQGHGGAKGKEADESNEGSTSSSGDQGEILQTDKESTLDQSAKICESNSIQARDKALLDSEVDDGLDTHSKVTSAESILSAISPLGEKDNVSRNAVAVDGLESSTSVSDEVNVSTGRNPEVAVADPSAVDLMEVPCLDSGASFSSTKELSEEEISRKTSQESHSEVIAVNDPVFSVTLAVEGKATESDSVGLAGTHAQISREGQKSSAAAMVTDSSGPVADETEVTAPSLSKDVDDAEVTAPSLSKDVDDAEVTAPSLSKDLDSEVDDGLETHSKITSAESILSAISPLGEKYNVSGNSVAVDGLESSASVSDKVNVSTERNPEDAVSDSSAVDLMVGPRLDNGESISSTKELSEISKKASQESHSEVIAVNNPVCSVTLAVEGKATESDRVGLAGTHAQVSREGQNSSAAAMVKDSSGPVAGEAEVTAPSLSKDVSLDSTSQTDSLEGQWGSVSEPSTQDIPIEKEAAASNVSDAKANLKVAQGNPNTTYVFDAPSFMTLVEPGRGNDDPTTTAEIQPTKPQGSQDSQAGWFPSLTQVVKDSEGRKKNEEIIAKVTNWSTSKSHTPLRSLLNEANMEIKNKSPPPQDQPDMHVETAPSEMGKNPPASENKANEVWNSPARMPVDSLKIEKRKPRGKPSWVPFVCCSSVN